MKLNILRDFSYTPGPRYIVEGEFSGEQFRQEKLRAAMTQAIADDDTLEIELDGTAGYGRSFFEEAFGGLVRIDKMDYSDIVSHLKIISTEEPEWIDKIAKYLKKAHDEEAVAKKK